MGKQDITGQGFMGKDEFTSEYNSFPVFLLCSLRNEMIFKPGEFLCRIDNDGDVADSLAI